MNFARFSGALLVLSLAAAWTQEPPKSVPQPIAFKHRTHSAAGLKCLNCHAIRSPGDAAGFPPVSTCMACHTTIKTDSPEIQKLASYAKTQSPVPWARVYRLPKTIYFSHEVHYRKANVDCAICHGPVAEKDALVQEKSIAMKDCMACHDQRKASTDCALCHDSY